MTSAVTGREARRIYTVSYLLLGARPQQHKG